MSAKLPDGYFVERDSDGDFVLIPPPDVTIFSEPGEPVLLGADNKASARIEALDYLGLA